MSILRVLKYGFTVEPISSILKSGNAEVGVNMVVNIH